MHATQRAYHADTDFGRVRDLLIETFPHFFRLSNWRIERWNYCRYLVAPFFGDPDPAASAACIRYWEETTRIWEDANGRIVGVVNIEAPAEWHPEYNEVWLQRRPGGAALLDEMLAYAEATFPHPKTGVVTVHANETDAELAAALEKRGFVRDAEPSESDAEYVITEPPQVTLPRGYAFVSMADENNLARRSEIFGRSFNHPDPKDWASLATIAEMQRAPDYHPELDLVLTNPAGEGVACCTIWWDEINRIGILEPVGTHPDYRRRGLGRAVVWEAIRRVAARGARSVWVGSAQPFYLAIGFRWRGYSSKWRKG